MPIPDYQEVMLPVLECLADGKEHSLADVREAISDRFALTEEERNELIPSGKQRVIANRVGWARTYMKKAGLLAYPKRGHLLITDSGLDLLKEQPAAVDVKLLKRYPGFLEFWTRKPDDGEEVSAVAESKTPEEVLQESYDEIRANLEGEILQLVLSCTPGYFERIVVELLVKMGYGGSLQDAGEVLGKSGDEGVDGVIKEDRLGLDLLYVQAKRWENQVSRPEVQKFAGALQGKKAKKGVFITTSGFSSGARDFAESIDSRLVLIDGRELARLMVDFDLGVSTESTFAIKKIDHDYFDEES